MNTSIFHKYNNYNSKQQIAKLNITKKNYVDRASLNSSKGHTHSLSMTTNNKNCSSSLDKSRTNNQKQIKVNIANRKTITASYHKNISIVSPIGKKNIFVEHYNKQITPFNTSYNFHTISSTKNNKSSLHKKIFSPIGNTHISHITPRSFSPVVTQVAINKKKCKNKSVDYGKNNISKDATKKKTNVSVVIKKTTKKPCKKLSCDSVTKGAKPQLPKVANHKRCSSSNSKPIKKIVSNNSKQVKNSSLIRVDSRNSHSSKKTCVSVNNSVSCSSKSVNIYYSGYKSILNIEFISREGVDSNKNKKINQDNFFIESNEQYSFIGVCDGHGTNGHYVSEYVKQTIPNVLEYQLKEKTKGLPISTFCYTPRFITKLLENTYISTNSKLSNNTKIDTNFSGTTCLSAFFLNFPNNSKINRLYIANVGDSRGIVVRGPYVQNPKWSYEQLTRDQKPNEKDEQNRILRFGGELKQFCDSTGKFGGPVRIYVKRSKLPGLAMSRSFGDQIASSVGVICEPEIKEYVLKEEDKCIVLASDGLWEYVSNEKVCEIVSRYYSESGGKEKLTERLYKEAKKSWEEYDVHIDDITIIVIFVG